MPACNDRSSRDCDGVAPLEVNDNYWKLTDALQAEVAERTESDVDFDRDVCIENDCSEGIDCTDEEHTNRLQVTANLGVCDACGSSYDGVDDDGNVIFNEDEDD